MYLDLALVGLWSSGRAEEVLQGLVKSLRANREAFWHPSVGSASSAALDSILSHCYDEEEED